MIFKNAQSFPKKTLCSAGLGERQSNRRSYWPEEVSRHVHHCQSAADCLFWTFRTCYAPKGTHVVSRFSYNTLTGEFVDHVLDPKYFGGKCAYVYNGEWKKFTYDSFCENLRYNDDEKNYRKPYNYHAYRFVVLSFIGWGGCGLADGLS